VETIDGTSGNDTFNGVFSGTNGADATFQTGDILNGGAGTDRLNLTIANALGTADPQADLNSVEQVYIRDLAGVSLKAGTWTGVQEIWTDRSTGNLTVTGITSNAAIGINSSKANVDATFADGTFAIGSTVTLAVNGAGDSVTPAASVVTVGQATAVGNASTLAVNAVGGTNIVEYKDGTNAVGTLKTINVSGSGSLELTANGTEFAAVKTFNASSNTGGVTFVGAAALQEVTGGSGKDSIKLSADLADKGFVKTGAGDDTVDLNSSDVALGATIELGAGNDTLKDTNATVSVINKDAVIDGGDGTDTLALTLVGATNIGAFKNFEVFDVAGLNGSIDAEILATKNTVTEFVGSDALAGNSSVVNVGAGVNFRATGDMGATNTTNTLTLTQKTAGALTITLDADEKKADDAADTADTKVAATNATSIKAVFAADYKDALSTTLTNTSTIDITAVKAASLEIVSGGTQSENVLKFATDDVSGTDAKSTLKSISISGDQKLSLGLVELNSSTNDIASIDAGSQTGGLNTFLANVKNGGSITLGSGTDVIAVSTASTIDDATGTKVESIVGFEKSTSTTDATAIKAADKISLDNNADGTLEDVAVVASATGTGYSVTKGVLSFTGTGPSTLQAAAALANDATGTTVGNAVVFEYVGSSYLFIEGTTDTLVKLTGVNGIASLNEVGTDNYLYIA